MASAVENIARLDAEAQEHRRKERHHRRQAIRAARERDALIAWCNERGIPVHIITGGAAPKGGTAP